jgi:hypothetical protein
MQRFARVAGVISRRLRKDGKLPRALTVHRYYPGRSLGGMPGMLDFYRASVDALIEEGYADTCAHDCKVNNCVIPAAGRSSQRLPEIPASKDASASNSSGAGP